jgi:peptide deformylase
MMIRDIVTDKDALSRPSREVIIPDQWVHANTVIEDLLDTAEYHRTRKEGCLGLAANQIGFLTRIIVVWINNEWVFMINPVVNILPGKFGQSHEQCLSRPSVNVKVKRAKRIQVTHRVQGIHNVTVKLTGLTARIVQHEVDHLNGNYIS